jgi:predicted RNA-binding protein with PIN domain
VFDAADAPPGLPKVLAHAGMTVRFAPRRSDADTLIEELIASNRAPRRLVVVSSDHRIQRAARRRRAKPVDSDVWLAELARRRRQRQASAPADTDSKPPDPLPADEVQFWLQRFTAE